MTDYVGVLISGDFINAAPTSKLGTFIFGAYLAGSQLAPAAPANIAPIVTWVTPTPGDDIISTDAITFTVTDSNVALLVVSTLFEGGVQEVVYRSSAFADAYVGSTVSVLGDVTTFILRRRLGWFASVDIQVDVCDSGGSVV